jgi:hypothetical protein
MYYREGIGGNMPKVKFLQDFQGRETGEVFYKLGQEATLPGHMTTVLVADRRAELVKETDAPVVFENVTGVETVTPAPEYAEPDIFVEPEQEETPPTVEDVITTAAIKPKRSKRGKK